MNKVIDKGFRSCRFVSTIVKHPVYKYPWTSFTNALIYFDKHSCSYEYCIAPGAFKVSYLLLIASPYCVQDFGANL